MVQGIEMKMIIMTTEYKVNVIQTKPCPYKFRYSPNKWLQWRSQQQRVHRNTLFQLLATYKRMKSWRYRKVKTSKEILTKNEVLATLEKEWPVTIITNSYKTKKFHGIFFIVSNISLKEKKAWFNGKSLLRTNNILLTWLTSMKKPRF